MQTSAYPGWVTVFDEQGVATLYPIKYAPFSAQSCLQAQAQSGASGGQTSDGSVTNTGMKSPYPGWVVVIDEQGVRRSTQRDRSPGSSTSSTDRRREAKGRAWRGPSSAPTSNLERLAARGLGVHFPAVFDTLSDKLQATLGGLGRSGRLDEEAISKAMREIRLALLEADVNLEVARDFTATVKERALGQSVLKSLTPGQQVVKIVHEELTALMGSGDSRLAFGRPPTVILLAGLQGSGKTTAVGSS